jgi:glycerophosphoryl diester phosphodiesterase
MPNAPRPRDADVLLALPFAHRGLFDNAGPHPENSLGAFAAAKAAGFGIELDVALTSDDEIVAFHDDDTSRLCGVPGALKETPLAQLRALRLLGTAQGVPSFKDVLSLVGGAVPLVVELKSFDARSGFHHDGRLEEAVVAACRGYEGPLCFKSFNPGTLARLREAGAPGPVGLLACNYERDGDFPFLSAAQAQAHANLTSPEARAADFISYNVADLNTALRDAVKADGRGRPLLVWTVRTQEHFALAQKLADNVVFEWRGVRPERFRP